MPALKAAFEGAGYEDVVTYIQSGNVLFSAPSSGQAEPTKRVEALIGGRSLRRERGPPEPSQMRAVVDKAPKGSGGNRPSTATT